MRYISNKKISPCLKVTNMLLFVWMNFRVEEYIRANGSSPFHDWFTTLDIQAAAKITTSLLRLQMGNTANIKWFKGIGEMKIDWGGGYRIYLAKQSETQIILFGGGTKRHQQSDINHALFLWKEYRSRKKESLPDVKVLRKK